MTKNALVEKIRLNVIGEKQPITTSLGVKPLIYADYTASGRSLRFIEQYIQSKVMPYYANTHSETSYTGAQTMALREQARQQIKDAVGGTEQDKLIFCGSGATAAINKLIDILNLRLPADLNDRYDFSSVIAKEDRPVVFIGPYEHHSNELPWRESIATLVCIPLDEQGNLDINVLEECLIKYQNKSMKIGSFSAASNVTGLKTNVEAITQLLHRYNALSFWDYAASAPYVKIEMNGGPEGSHKDAVFISPHKFVGGPGTPGVLVVKESVVKNSIPTIQGGGTVVYVTPEDHRYIDDVERREEGGTPAIIESIRAGLVFKLQQEVGTDEICARENAFVERASARFKEHENISVLGGSEAARLSITSLRISHKGKDLHYGFVVALLNDLFGIQARGGCSCAGPYGHKLLGMSMTYSKAIEAQIFKGAMILRPGWVRLNFNYFIDEETFDYLLCAIELIAQFGWRMLPYYDFNTNDGVWRYQAKKVKPAVQWQDFDFMSGTAQAEQAQSFALKGLLQLAKKELSRERSDCQTFSISLSPQVEDLRWFVLPQDIDLSTIQQVDAEVAQ